MQNLENLEVFEFLITQKLLKCLKDPFLDPRSIILFVPQAPDLLEKFAESLLYNFHHKHSLLKSKIKRLLRKISPKT